MKEYNHSTNLVLSPLPKRFQTLYSSQSYESFYSIFVRFNVTSNNSNSILLNSYELELINYKGPVDIEISRACLTKLDTTTNDGRNIFHLKLTTKALLTKPTDPEILINITNPVINHGDILICTRELVSFTEETINELSTRINNSRDPEEAVRRDSFMNGIFDNEFYYRNGRIIRIRNDGDFTLPVDIEDYFKDKDVVPIEYINKMVNGTISCHNSIGYFYIDN